MLCGSHIKIWNITNHIKMLDLLVKNWKLRVWCSLFHFFSCDLQDFKFWYVNHKTFGASVLCWVDFTMVLLSIPFNKLTCNHHWRTTNHHWRTNNNHRENHYKTKTNTTSQTKSERIWCLEFCRWYFDNNWFVCHYLF